MSIRTPRTEEAGTSGRPYLPYLDANDWADLWVRQFQSQLKQTSAALKKMLIDLQAAEQQYTETK
jgi:hypothetical protein